MSENLKKYENSISLIRRELKKVLNKISKYEISVYDALEFIRELEQRSYNLAYAYTLKRPKLYNTNPTIEEVEAYSRKLRLFEEEQEEYEYIKNMQNDFHKELADKRVELIKESSSLKDIPEQYRDKVYNFAYQERHSSGYVEILSFIEELCEIFT